MTSALSFAKNDQGRGGLKIFLTNYPINYDFHMKPSLAVLLYTVLDFYIATLKNRALKSAMCAYSFA